MKLNRIKKTLEYPPVLLVYMDMKNILRLKDDLYLKILYKSTTNKRLDLDNPKTFNEKLQWLKLNNRKKEYTIMVDKYEAKKYVAEIIGGEHIIPNIGVWDRIEDIDFNTLPDKFVLKCTHDSGGNIICKDKESLDINKAIKKMNDCLKRNYYYIGREWPYKDVKPRIIAENYMTDESKKELKDYKIFNFNGIPKLIQVDFDRFSNHKRNIYDVNWNLLDCDIFCGCTTNKETNKQESKPINLEEMLEYAKKLSKGIPFLRTDFYSINGKIYFSELTFFPGGGMRPYTEKYDNILGDWIVLPEGKEEKNEK